MEIVEITDKSEFELELKKSPLVLADFYAKWCAPCKMQSPVLYEFNVDAGDKVSILKIDVDENAEVADGLNVGSIPTLVLFSNGKEVERRVGLTSKSQLSDMLIKHL